MLMCSYTMHAGRHAENKLPVLLYFKDNAIYRKSTPFRVFRVYLDEQVFVGYSFLLHQAKLIVPKGIILFAGSYG